MALAPPTDPIPRLLRRMLHLYEVGEVDFEALEDTEEQLYSGSEDYQQDNYSAPSLEDLAVGEVPQEFRCPICMDIFRGMPVCAVPCGHLFCRACLGRHAGECVRAGASANCPLCRTDLDCAPVPVHALGSLIGATRARCPNGLSYNLGSAAYEPCTADTACQEVMRIDQLSEHKERCSFEPVSCKFNDGSPHGCPSVLPRGQLAEHERSCPYRFEECECGHRVRAREAQEHKEVCPAAAVGCPNPMRGCSVKVPPADLPLHLANCPHERRHEAEVDPRRQRKRKMEEGPAEVSSTSQETDRGPRPPPRTYRRPGPYHYKYRPWPQTQYGASIARAAGEAPSCSRESSLPPMDFDLESSASCATEAAAQPLPGGPGREPGTGAGRAGGSEVAAPGARSAEGLASTSREAPRQASNKRQRRMSLSYSSS